MAKKNEVEEREYIIPDDDTRDDKHGGPGGLGTGPFTEIPEVDDNDDTRDSYGDRNLERDDSKD